MKKLSLIMAFFFTGLTISNAQANGNMTQDTLSQIKKREHQGTITNDTLLAKFIKEYLFEAESHGLDLIEHVNKIKWIIIEPETTAPLELTGLRLAKTDKDQKLIMISRTCLIDRNILNFILFRELSHYLGVPYNLDMVAIMLLDRPKVYSYGWIDDPFIREVEYKQLFKAVEKYLIKL